MCAYVCVCDCFKGRNIPICMLVFSAESKLIAFASSHADLERGLLAWFCNRTCGSLKSSYPVQYRNPITFISLATKLGFKGKKKILVQVMKISYYLPSTHTNQITLIYFLQLNSGVVNLFMRTAHFYITVISIIF